MRRRTRIDLGQEVSSIKEETVLDRKRQRWAERNKDKLDENPFLRAIKPDQEHYGHPEETGNELKARLNNLEFGNFPGYFNYRNKATSETANDNTDQAEDKHSEPTNKKCHIDTQIDSSKTATEEKKHGLEQGLLDDRLGYFKKDWFEGKNVLDIGCNRGHITYAIARLFDPKSIVGIDIDSKIINMANRDLHLHLEDGVIKGLREYRLERATKLRQECSDDASYSEDPKQFTLSSYISQGPIAIAFDPKESGGEFESTESTTATVDSGYCRFPNNIVFIEHNYVLARDEFVEKQKAYFDTIVCLSVTKWIHLNYRDDGLKRFFKRIYNHLRPNGLFILEAQPFDNYGRRKKLSDRLRANYYSIQFKPDEFDAYLLSEQVGFRQIIQETVTGGGECSKGFRRPLRVFLK